MNLATLRRDDAFDGPAAGVLRWGEDERREYNRRLKLFQTNPSHKDGIDPSRGTETPYLQGIWTSNRLFKRHPKKNFYQNARRLHNEFLADEAKRGRRRRSRECALFIETV